MIRNMYHSIIILALKIVRICIGQCQRSLENVRCSISCSVIMFCVISYHVHLSVSSFVSQSVHLFFDYISPYLVGIN